MNARCKMGEQRLLLCFVFLCVTLVSVDALLGEGDETESFIRCVHDVNEQIVYGVQQDPNDSRGKRQSGQQYQPFRMHIYYDSTVNELSSTQRNRLQNIVMPSVESNIEAALSVIPATSPILLDRDCVDGTFQLPIGSVRQCSTQCANQTFCVLAQVPEEHLKHCDQCNGMAPNCETIGSNGPGVSNADYILYVGANSASPCGGSVLAFANLCQLESTLDRPIAGAINFCPSQFAVRSDEDNIRIGIHEVVHALGFSPTAYPFFRDENGNPRTPRDQFGLPPTDASGRFVPSNTTIRTTTYPDWQTRSGAINHEVLQFVTPNVVEQARIHYNCSTIEGVELENQGGAGTRSAHFEQRILGNEGMTGVLLFNIRFSRVTFGLMEDTGWYRPNYNMAEPLAWGHNTGCIIPHGSCGEWIETQQRKGATLAPYCNHLAQNPLRLGCTIDREFVSGCNLIDYGTTPIPSEFQYFNFGPNFNTTVGPRAGGSLQTPDYCPFQLPLMFVTGDSRVCNQEADLPTTNLYAETYGPGSRCVEHGRQWFQTMSGTNSTSTVYGGGCYQYSCSVSLGVRIQVLGHWFQCNCEGEELILDIIGSGSRYQGSLICPSCGQLCFDRLSFCPDPEPTTCYGRETFITVSVTEPFTCYQDISSSGTCVDETGQTFSASDCCNGLGGGAYMQNNGSCVPCPQSEAYLLYADGGIGTIYRSDLNGSDIQQLVTGLPRPVALDFDYRQNDMYWSDVSTRTISRANLDGSGVTTMVNSEISVVDGLSVDWVNGKLYWTDASLRCIEVYDVSSGIRRELLRTGLNTIPRAIVVDPANRLMYWSDWGSVASIERASMDGEARQILHNTALVYPNGLTLDYQNQVLYWIDAFLDKIESSNVDGTNRQLILSFSSNQHPFAISLFNNILYWSDWGTDTIHSIVVGGTGINSLISGLSFPTGIEVVSESRQQLSPGQNPCAENNGGCSHLCLLSAVAADGFTCNCPDDLDLEENGKNCSGNNSSFTSAFYPFGASVGDFQLPRFLDGSSSAIFLPTPIQFFETAENILYVNTNGILSFRFTFTSSSPRPFPFFGSPLIAPFWENVDIRQFGNIFYRQTSNTTLLQRARDELQELFPSSGNFTPTRLVIATWERVPGFLQGSRENTFQVVIATDGQRTFVFFVYGDIEWGSANIGFNAGDNLRFFTVPGTDSRDIEEGTNVGRRGVFIFRVDQCSIRGPVNAGSGSGSGIGGCCSLPNPVNGQVQFTDTTVGSVALYSCFFGYILNGTSTRTCEADGEWSGDPPTCDPVDCGPLDDPENGTVFHSRTTFGSSAFYSCVNGFVVVGSSVRTCLASGNWSGSAPTCQISCGSLPNPLNGQVQINGTTVGSVANYSCNQRSTLNGTTTRICEDNGEWSGDPPTCERNDTVNENFYPFGVSVGDAQVPVALDGSSPPISLFIPFQFFESSESTLFVNTNGHLSFRSRFLSFTPQRFPTSFGPPLIAPFWDDVDIRQFGNISYRQTFNATLLQRAHNEIEELFPSSGSFTPTVLVIATWYRVAGFSQGLQENTFQVVIATDGQRTFVFLIYDVIEWGVANIGFNAGDGVRSFMLPGALTVQSRDIQERSNVGRTGVFIYRVDQCSITGPAGFRSGSAAGSGSGMGGCCSLPNPVNGQVQFPDTTVGSVANYFCNAGYILNGISTRTCEADGEWSGEPPTCDRSGSGSGIGDCGSLPNPVNGQVEFPDTTVGSVANYSCFFGYILNGTSTRTCEADGEWSGDPPTCDPVDCGPLDDPENGDVSVSGTRVGSFAYYYCFSGYRLIGNSFRTCLASGNWSGSAPICQELAQFGLERQLYSTAEGDEDLEVCVELLQGNITQRTFIGISSSQSGQFPSDVLPLNTSILTFDIGDTQECVPIQVVDDDLLEDTESFFVSIFPASFAAIVPANRSSANVLISDNEVVLVGFNASSYTVDEGANQVQVCVRLVGTAELAQPVQMRVSSSKDGTATANEDFRPVLQLLTLPVGSSSGSTRCMPVYIIDDTEPETSEEIILTLFVADVAVVVATDGETTTVVIQDNEDFFIQFINDTPDVEGNQVTVSFTSSMPLASATCQTQPRPNQNCINQTAVFTGLPPNRRRAYDVIITATSMFGQSATISRQFRSGTINDCGAHLINQGVVVSGNSATVEWQGTGPDPNNRVQDFQCSLDGGTFSSCTSPHVLTQLPVGEHVLRITPEGSDCRRRISRDVPFQIK